MGLVVSKVLLKTKHFQRTNTEDVPQTFKAKTFVLKCSKTKKLNLSNNWTEFCIELDTNSPTVNVSFESH